MKSSRTQRSRAPALPPEPPLRVALYAFRLSDELRSSIAYALDLARALSADADVHLFTNDPGIPSPHGVQMHQVRATGEGEGPVARARALCAAAVEHFARVDQDCGPFQIAHACQWSAAPAALSGRRHGAQRTVVSFLDTVFSREGHGNGTAQVGQIRRLEQQAVQDADLLLAGSEPVRQELAWLYGAAEAKVHLIPADAIEDCAPGGAAPAREQLGLSGDGPVVAFAADWTATSGSDLFLAAAGWIAGQRPDCRFIVAAHAGKAVRIEADIRRRGLGGIVHVAPETVAVADVCAASDVVVVPARQPVDGAAVFRAWQASRPVVATRSGPAHVVQAGRNGALCYPFARSVGEATLDLLEDPVRAAAWGAEGRRCLEETFTWPVAASKVNKLYRALAGRPGSGTETKHGP